MKNQNKSIIYAGAWYMVANVILGSMAFITTPIFSRLMDKSEFGMFQTYLSLVGVMTPFITLNVEATLLNGKYDHENKYDEFVLSIIGLVIVVALLWIFFLFVCLVPDGFLGFNRYYLVSIVLYCVFFEVITIYRLKERNFYRYKNSSRVSVAVVVISAIVSLFLVNYMEDKLLARIAGYIIPTMGFGIVIFFNLLRSAGKISCQYWRYSLPICLPFIPHVFSMTALNSIDKVMIMEYCGPEYTALYGIAYMCGRISALIADAMNSAYSPCLADDLMKQDYSAIRKDSRIYILSYSFFYFGIILIAPEILYFLGGTSYMVAIYAIGPVMVGGVFQFLYTMYVNIEQILKQTKWLPFASILAAVINYLLNLLFIPQFGYLAAAYTTLIGYLCLLLAHMFIVWRMGLGRVYSCKFIFVIIVGIIGGSIMISSLYQMMSIRLWIFLVYSVGGVYLLYKKWRTMKDNKGIGFK